MPPPATLTASTPSKRSIKKASASAAAAHNDSLFGWATKRLGITDPKPKGPQTFLTQKDWTIIVALAAVSLGIRLWRVDQPNKVVFDEVHFGKFTNYYLRGTYFFDLHPPLAKLLLALLCWLLDYDGSYPFYAINDSYEGWEVPFAEMRSVSAVMGGLLVPLTYWILRELDVSVLASFTAAVMLCFDNALVTQSRFILLDAQLLLPIMFATLSWLKFSKYQLHEPFGKGWWTWLTLTGFVLGLAISNKSIGVLIVAVVGIFTIDQLFRILLTKPFLEFLRHFQARALCLIALPLFMFALFFAVHFTLLPKTGPGDAFMSQEFQDELIGNHYAISPKSIAYGSTITIRNVNCEGYLSANSTKYPGMSDGVVGGSYLRNDNNYWIIMPLNERELENKRVKMIEPGSHFRLLNKATKLYLASKQKDTVFPSKNWNHVGVVKSHTPEDHSTVWTIDYTPNVKLDGGDMLVQFAQFRLMNQDTRAYLITHPKKMDKKWGNGLYEVGTVPVHDGLLWVVIEHEHPKLPMHPKPAYKLSFLEKLNELLRAMNYYNAGLAVSHPWQSDPWEWAILHRGISFWSEFDTQVYLIGNPLVWWGALVTLLTYIIIIVLDEEERTSDDGLLAKGRFFLVAWVFHYLPFFTMERCLFLHHYFAAFIFSVLISALVLDRVQQQTGPKWVFQAIVAVLIVVAMGLFVFFAPLTYGLPLTANELAMRQWFPAWDYARITPRPIAAA